MHNIQLGQQYQDEDGAIATVIAIEAHPEPLNDRIYLSVELDGEHAHDVTRHARVLLLEKRIK